MCKSLKTNSYELVNLKLNMTRHPEHHRASHSSKKLVYNCVDSLKLNTIVRSSV